MGCSQGGHRESDTTERLDTQSPVLIVISAGRPCGHLYSRRHYFTNKGPSRQSYDFSSGHVWM